MIYFEITGGLIGVCHYPDFLTGWFELIGELVEPQGHGKKYPVFFGDFYAGKVSYDKLPQLLTEVKEIWGQLKHTPLNIDRIYSDKYFKNVPDLDNQIKKEATNYGDVFWEMYGHEDFFYCLVLTIGEAMGYQSDLKILNKIGPNGI